MGGRPPSVIRHPGRGGGRGRGRGGRSPTGRGEAAATEKWPQERPPARPLGRTSENPPARSLTWPLSRLFQPLAGEPSVLRAETAVSPPRQNPAQQRGDDQRHHRRRPAAPRTPAGPPSAEPGHLGSPLRPRTRPASAAPPHPQEPHALLRLRAALAERPGPGGLRPQQTPAAPGSGGSPAQHGPVGRIPVSSRGRRGTGKELEDVGLARVQHGQEPPLREAPACSVLRDSHSCLGLVCAASAELHAQGRLLGRCPQAHPPAGADAQESISAAPSPGNPATRFCFFSVSIPRTQRRVAPVKYRRHVSDRLWLKPANVAGQTPPGIGEAAQDAIPATGAPPGGAAQSHVACGSQRPWQKGQRTCDGRCRARRLSKASDRPASPKVPGGQGTEAEPGSSGALGTLEDALLPRNRPPPGKSTVSSRPAGRLRREAWPTGGRAEWRGPAGRRPAIRHEASLETSRWRRTAPGQEGASLPAPSTPR